MKDRPILRIVLSLILIILTLWEILFYGLAFLLAYGWYRPIGLILSLTFPITVLVCMIAAHKRKMWPLLLVPWIHFLIITLLIAA